MSQSAILTCTNILLCELHNFMHIQIRTYKHRKMHTYIHTYIHTHIQKNIPALVSSSFLSPPLPVSPALSPTAGPAKPKTIKRSTIYMLLHVYVYVWVYVLTCVFNCLCKNRLNDVHTYISTTNAMIYSYYKCSVCGEKSKLNWHGLIILLSFKKNWTHPNSSIVYV